MAGLHCSIQFEDVSISSSSTKTVAAVIAPSNHRLRITGVRLHANGASGTDVPLKVTLQRASSDGTGTSQTPTKTSTHSETVQSTGKKAYSSEPTVTDEIYRWGWHPQASLIELFTFDTRPEVGGGGIMCLRVETGGQSQSISGCLDFEE